MNHSKNIQIDLYEKTSNCYYNQNLYDLDFNSNLKNKEKTIIIDDIEELQDEYDKNNDNVK